MCKANEARRDMEDALKGLRGKTEKLKEEIDKWKRPIGITTLSRLSRYSFSSPCWRRKVGDTG